MRYALYAVLASVGVLIAWLTAALTNTRVKVTRIVLGAVGGAIVALILVQAGVETLLDQDQEGSGEAPTAEPATSSPTTATPSTTSSTPPSSPSASPDVARYFLSDLSTLRTEKEGRPGGCTGGCTGFGSGAARIAGEVYPNSFTMDVAADGRRSTATWNTARRCSTLKMSAGLDDSRSPNTEVTFSLTLDDERPLVLGAVGRSEPLDVEATVSGAAQVLIAAYVTGPIPDVEVPVLLGDAALTCEQGALDPVD